MVPARPEHRHAELAHGKATGLDRRSAERLRRGRLPIDGRLDLHGMSQAAAAERLAEFIAGAQGAGKRCLLVITGKGLAGGGVLREQVPRWLNQPPNRGRVLAFDYAQAQHGGMGALYVLLKRRRDVMTPFGLRLRELRRERGRRLKDMAQALGVSEAYLSALEHGHRGRPGGGLVQQVSAYFNLAWDDVDELRRLAELSHPRVVIDTAGQDPLATELANRLAETIGELDRKTLQDLLARLDKA